MEAQGWVCLPALRTTMRRERQRPELPESFREPEFIEEALSALQPLEILQVSAGTDVALRWAGLIERYHYLGFHSVGKSVWLLALSK